MPYSFQTDVNHHREDWILAPRRPWWWWVAATVLVAVFFAAGVVSYLAARGYPW